MPTFADIIARPHLDALYVLHISGLPIVWSQGRCPARWGLSAVALGGEDYVWSARLRPGEAFGAIGVRIEPKGGVGQSGGQDFDLIALGYQTDGIQTDSVLSLLLATLTRGDGGRSASLAVDLPANEDGVGTGLAFVYNPWSVIAVPSYLFLGTETVRLQTVTVNTGVNLTSTVTRGRFGSQPQTHVGQIRDGAAVAGGAMYVASYPLTMTGRIATLRCCPGEWMRGASGWEFIPFAANIDGPENQIIYAGVIDGTNEDGPIVTLRSSSLDQLVKGEAVKGAPTAAVKSGSTLIRGGIYIGGHNRYVHLDLEIDGAVHFPLLHIANNAALTVGDSFTIGAVTLTAGTHWAIGASVLITYINIAGAINTALPASVLSAASMSFGVELRPATTNPTSTSLSASTANPSAITFTTPTLAPSRIRALPDQPLRRSQNGDGQAPFEDVPSGLYTHGQLGDYLTDTMTEWLPRPYSIRFGLEYVESGSGEGGRFYLYCDIFPSRQGEAARVVVITTHGQYQSFLRDLGFTEPEYEMTGGESSLSFNGRPRFEVVATKAPATLRAAAHPTALPDRIYFQSIDTWSAQFFNADGWVDDGGALIRKHAWIKDVGLISFDAYVSDATGFYLDGVRRGDPRLCSPNTEEVYVEHNELEPKDVECRRIVALPFVSANRMMLYLLLGGSGFGTNHATYDQGWPGAGLHIPSGLVDVDSFEALNRERPEPRDGWVWKEGDDARKIFDEECKATQQQLVSDLGQLRLVAMNVPLEAAPSKRHVIGPAQTVTDDSKGVAFDRQPNRIVNVVRCKAGYDLRDNNPYLGQTNRQQDSIGTWGEQQAVEIELRGISAIGDGASKGRAIAQRIFGLYARPYALIEVDLAVKEAWLWRVGDEAELTHPWIPHPTQPRRGCTGMLCRVVNKQAKFAGGASKEFATLTLQSYALAGQRFTLWAPSAQLLYAGVANTWVVVESNYGPNNINGLYDSDYFGLGDAVKVMRLGNSAVATSATIATRTGAPGFVELTFSGAISGASGQRRVMWFADHDSAGTSDQQRKFAYMSNFSGDLALPSGTAPAFRYR